MATIIDHSTGKIYGPAGAAQVAHNWWALVIRGVLAVLLGVVAFFMPGVTLYALVFAFGTYALLDGGFNLVAGIRTRRETERWWALALSGVLGIGAGVTAFLIPETAALALLYLVSAWAIMTGVLEIAAAVRLRKEIEGEFFLGLSGLASLLLGLFMFFQPGAGALAWVWLFAVYAGAMLVALGLRLRKLDRRLAVT